MRTLLFIGGSEETVPAIRHARELGYRVFVTDQDHRSPCIEWADDWSSASTYDAKATIAAAKALNEIKKIDGVLAVACDVGPTVSLAAKELCLPHIPHVVTRLSHDKQLHKAWLYPGSIPVPTVASDEDKEWIIKPVDSRGGRGVFRVSRNGMNGEDIEELKVDALRYSKVGSITMERFIPGPQISVTTLVWNYRDIFTSLVDRNYDCLEQFAPCVIENGGEGPSIYEDTDHAVVVRAIVQRIIDHLGIKDGFFKSDFVLDNENNMSPILIEATFGRLNGGYGTTHIIPIAYGIDFLAAAYNIVCGFDPSPLLFDQRAQMFTCGRYELPGKVTNATERGRFFFGSGTTREEAVATAENNKANLLIMEHLVGT